MRYDSKRLTQMPKNDPGLPFGLAQCGYFPKQDTLPRTTLLHDPNDHPEVPSPADLKPFLPAKADHQIYEIKWSLEGFGRRPALPVDGSTTNATSHVLEVLQPPPGHSWHCFTDRLGFLEPTLDPCTCNCSDFLLTDGESLNFDVDDTQMYLPVKTIGPVALDSLKEGRQDTHPPPAVLFKHWMKKNRKEYT